MKLGKNIFGVGAMTGISRVFGFVRDMLIARFLGAGRMSDIFFAAFKLPNLFRDLLGEGALSAIFIPMYTDMKKDENFAKNVFSWLMVILLGITIVFGTWFFGRSRKDTINHDYCTYYVFLCYFYLWGGVFIGRLECAFAFFIGGFYACIIKHYVNLRIGCVCMVWESIYNLCDGCNSSFIRNNSILRSLASNSQPTFWITVDYPPLEQPD